MLSELLHLFYPVLCPACNSPLYRNEKTICFRCKNYLPRTRFHLQPGNALEQMFWGRVPFRAAAACFIFRKEGGVQHLLHELKYRNAPEIGREIGRMYGRELANANAYSEPEIIIPVPLHPNKYRVRGYNQSAVFGEGLEESLPGRLTTSVLIRSTNTSTQTRKSRFARWENVESTFAIENQEAIRNKHILLIDDVITTGATLEACAVNLFQAGAREISVACIATPL
jgi:ComF family protein